MKLRKPTTLLLSLLLTACWAHAQEGPPLSSTHVKGFVGALAELKKWSEENAERYEASAPTWSFERGDEAAAPLAGAVAALAGHEVLADIESILERHGFEDAESWAQIGDRIIRAYAAIKFEKEQPDMAAEMQKAMAQIEESKMSAQQKEAMRRAMMESQQMVAAFTNASAEDKAAVKPHMDELQREFEDEN